MNLMIQTVIAYLEMNAGLVIAINLALVALYGAVFFLKLGINKQDIKQAAYAGIALWVVFMLALPAATGSSLAQIAYFADYMMLFSTAFGFAALMALLILPALKLVQHFKTAE